MISICPKCGKEFENTTNRTYCSRSCANSRIQTPEINKKRSETVKNKILTSQQFQNDIKNFRLKGSETIKKNKLNRFVKCTNGQVIDITYQQLEDYRNNQQVCEICGKPERAIHDGKNIAKLCCDHDHKTSKFRGILCCDCNWKLGWFEKYEKEIKKYLNKKQM